MASSGSPFLVLAGIGFFDRSSSSRSGFSKSFSTDWFSDSSVLCFTLSSEGTRRVMITSSLRIRTLSCAVSFLAPQLSTLSPTNVIATAVSTLSLFSSIFDGKQISAHPRAGETACESSSWMSYSSVCCKIARAFVASGLVSITISSLISTATTAFSLISSSLSIGKQINVAGTGSSSITIFGQGYGITGFTIKIRTGASSSEHTKWESDTVIWVRLSHDGTAGSRLVALSHGALYGSLSSGYSFISSVVSILIPRNIVCTGSVFVTAYGSNFGLCHGTQLMRTDVSSCEQSAWVADSSVRCRTETGVRSSRTTILSSGVRMGSLTDGISLSPVDMSAVSISNSPSTGSILLTLSGTNFGSSSSSCGAMLAGTASAWTVWNSETSLICLDGRITRNSRRLSLSVGSRFRTLTGAFSASSLIISSKSVSNVGCSGSRTLSIFGSGFGVSAVSVVLRVSASFCTVTLWVSDTSIQSLNSPGIGTTGAVALTAGSRSFSMSDSFSFETASASLYQLSNGAATGANKFTLFGSNMGSVAFTLQSRVGHSSCENTVWVAETSTLGRKEGGRTRSQPISLTASLHARSLTFLTSFSDGVASVLQKQNCAVTGAVVVTVQAFNFGTAASSLSIRHSRSHCEATRWISDSSARCRISVANVNCRHVVLTAGVHVGSISSAVSASMLLSGCLQQSNRPETGSISLTLHGMGMGVAVVTASTAIGGTVCEETSWVSDTSSKCLAASSVAKSHRIAMSVPMSVGSLSSSCSVDSEAAISTSTSNVAYSGSSSLTIYGNLHSESSVTSNVGGTSCENTVWISDSCLTCSVINTQYGSKYLVMTVGESALSLTQLFSVDESVPSVIIAANSCATGALIISIIGNGYGISDISGKCHLGGTGFEQSSWISETAVKCKIGRGLGSSRRLIATFAAAKISYSESFSADRPGVSSVRQGNSVTSCLLSTSLLGSHSAMKASTVQIRMDLTACERTDWYADSSLSCRSAGGWMGSRRVIITANSVVSTVSQSYSFDLLASSTLQFANYQAAQSTFVIFTGESMKVPFTTISIGFQGSECESTLWQSDSSVNCFLSYTFASSMRLILTGGLLIATLSQGQSIDLPQISSQNMANFADVDSLQITICGNGFGMFSLSLTNGGSSFESSAWVSDTMTLCKTGRGSSGSQRVILTAGVLSGTLSMSLSFSSATASRLISSNIRSTGSTIVTVYGMGFGLESLTLSSSGTWSASSFTVWKSDTSVKGGIGRAGAMRTRDLVVTVGRAAGSLSAMLSSSLLLISSIRSKNSASTGSSVMTVQGSGLGLSGMSASSRWDGSSCECTSWGSDSSVRCRDAGGYRGSSRASISVGVDIGSSTGAYTFQATKMSSVLLANAFSSGAVLITLSGLNMGRLEYSAIVRAGQTACEQTIWTGDTCTVCRVSHGISQSQRLSITVGLMLGSVSRVWSISQGGVSTVLGPNVAMRGPAVVCVFGSNFGFEALSIGLNSQSSCQSSLWASDSSLLCRVALKVSASRNVVITAGRRVGSVTNALSWGSSHFASSAVRTNSCATGSAMVLLDGGLIGHVFATPEARLGSTACGKTLWISCTSLICLSSRSVQLSRSVHVSVGIGMGSLTSGVSVDVSVLSLVAGRNSASTGSVSLTASGNNIGLTSYSISATVGQTAGERSRWESDTSAACREGSGMVRTLGVVVTSGMSVGSASSGVSLDFVALRSKLRANVLASGSIVVTVMGSNMGRVEYSIAGGAGSSSNEQTLWESDTSVWSQACATLSGTLRFRLTVAQLEGSFSEAFSADVVGMSALAGGNMASSGSLSITIVGTCTKISTWTARVGHTALASTVWVSDSVLQGLCGLGSRIDSKRVSISSSFNRIGSVSSVLTFDYIGLSGSLYSNIGGQSSITLLFGSNLAIDYTTVAAAQGFSRCESSSWSSDTTCSCMPALGLSGSRRLMATAGARMGTVTDLFTLSFLSLSSFHSHNVAILSSKIFTFGSWGEFISPKTRFGGTSDIGSTWIADSSVHCMIGPGMGGSRSILLSVQYVGSTTTIGSYDQPVVAVQTKSNIKVIDNVGITLSSSGTTFGISQVARIGETNCQVTLWSSESSLFCKAASGLAFSLQTSMTCSESLGTLTYAVSYDLAHVSSISLSNCPSVGQCEFIIVGGGFGKWDTSPSFRIGRTGCITTPWLSDSSMKCMVPRGTGAAISIVSSLGIRASSSTVLFSYDCPIIFASTLSTLAAADLRDKTSEVSDILINSTRGNETIVFSGVNFGPNAADLIVTFGQPLTFSSYLCTVQLSLSNDSTLFCRVPAGVGMGHRIRVVVSGQCAISVDKLSYPPPEINSGGIALLLLEGTTKLPQVIGTTTVGWIDILKITGSNFGPYAEDVAITYGPSPTYSKFRCNIAVIHNCTSDNHTSICCYTDYGSGSDLRFRLMVGMQSTVSSDTFYYPSPVILPDSLLVPASLSKVIGNVSGSSTIGGIDIVGFAGLNFGPDHTILKVRYGDLHVSDFICPVVVEMKDARYPFIFCYTSSGIGKSMNFHVSLNALNASGKDMFSYPPPSIQSGSLRILGQRCLSLSRCFRINIDAEGHSRLIGRTTATGSDVVELDAFNLGPDLSEVAVSYGPCSDPCNENSFVPTYQCHVNIGAANAVNHSRIQCFVASGIGIGHYFMVSVGGQFSLSKDTFSYPSPVISSGSLKIVADQYFLPDSIYNPINIEASNVVCATTFGGLVMIELRGRNFGPSANDVTITYGPPMTADKYICTVKRDVASVFNHTFARCYLAAGSGSNLVFVVGVTTGQISDESIDTLSYPPPVLRSSSLRLLCVPVNSKCKPSSSVDGLSTLGGDELQFYGDNFGPEPSDIQVVLGRQFSPFVFVASVNKNETSQTSVQIKTGPGQGRFLNLIVTVSGQQSTSSDVFNYPQNVTFQNSGTMPSQMALYSENISSAVAGVHKVIILQPLIYPSPFVLAGMKTWIATAVSADSIGNCTVLDNFDGSYTIELFLTRSADYIVRIQVNPFAQNCIGSPFVVTVMPASTVDSTACQALGLDGSLLSAGSRSGFQLVAKDFFGNIVPAADDLFYADILSVDGSISGDIVDSETQTTLYLNLTVSSKYSVRIYYNGSAVSENPYIFWVVSGSVVVSKAILKNDSSTAYADADSIEIFCFQTNDYFGNCARDAVRQPSVAIAGSELLNPRSVLLIDNGTCIYSILCKITRSGNYSILVGFGALLDPAPFSPLHIVVRPGVPFTGACRAAGLAISEGLAGVNESFQIFVYDHFGNPIVHSGINGVFILERIDDSLRMSVSNWNFERDNYYGTYYVQKSAWYSISLLFDGSHIFGSPFQALVLPSVVDASFCTAIQTNLVGSQLNLALQTGNLANLPSRLVGMCDHQALHIVVFAKDRFQNIVFNTTGVNFTLEIYGRKYTAAFSGYGAFTFSVTDEPDAGVSISNISIMLGRQEIAGSPFLILSTESCGHLNPQDCFLVNLPGLFIAGEASELLVQSVDSNGLYLSTGGYVAAANLFISNQILILHGRDMSDGIYSIIVNCTISGNYTLLVTLQGSVISGSPYSISIVAGAVSAERSLLLGMTVGTAGTVGTFTIQTKDHFSNLIHRSIGAAGSLTALLTGPVERSASLVDLDDGTYSGEYALTTSGQYIINVMLSQSNIWSKVGSALGVSLLAGDPSLGNSLFSGQGISLAAAGITAEFGFALSDIYNNLVIFPTSQFVVFKDNQTKLDGDTRRISNNLAIFSYVLTKSGQYVCSVHIPKYWLHESFFTFAINVVSGTASAKYSKLLLENNVVLVGQTLNGTIITIDYYGNNCSTGGELITFQLCGHVNITAQVSDLNNGIYTATVAPIILGRFISLIMLNGQIGGKDSKLNVTILPGPVSVSCSIFRADPGSGNSLVAGNNFTFVMYFRDQFCNPTEYDVRLLTLESNPRSAAFWAQQQSASQARLMVRFTQAALYTLRILVNGVKLNGSPQNITVSPNVIESRSTVVSGAGTLRALAGSFSSFSIVARDSFGNKVDQSPFNIVPDYQATLYLILSDVVVSGLVTSYQNGSFICTYLATVSGQYALRLSFQGVSIFKSTILVMPSQMSASHSYLNISRFALMAGEKLVLTVYARDIFNNPTVAGGFLTVSVLSKQAVLSDLALKYQNNSAYSTDLVLYSAGSYEIYTVLAGSHILNSPDKITVIADTVPASYTTVASGSGTIGGLFGTTLQIWVYVRDAFENTVTAPALSMLVLTVQWPSGISTYPALKWNKTLDYNYFTEYNAQELGQATLSVLLAGVHIKDSPFPLQVVASVSEYVDAGKSFIFDESFGVVYAGAPSLFTIQSVGLDGFYLNKGGAIISATLESNESASWQLPVTDMSNGGYLVSLNLNVSGFYKLSILLQGSPISGSPFLVQILPSEINTLDSVFYGSGLSLATAGLFCAFNLQARDRYLNYIVQSAGPLDQYLSVSFDGPARADVSALDNLDGTYTVRFQVTAAGQYKIKVTSLESKVHALVGNFLVEVLASEPAIVSSTLYGEGLSGAVAGRIADIRIDARDLYGNRATVLPIGDLDLYFVDAFAIFNAVMVGKLCSISYLVTAAGNYHLQFNLSQSFLSLIPVAVMAAEADPKRCTADGDGIVEVTAGSVATFTISSRDSYGNELNTGGYSFFTLINSAHRPFRGSVSNNNDGSYSVNYLVTIAGMIQASVLKGTVHISGSPYVIRVQPASLSPQASVVSLGPMSRAAVAGTDATILILAKDEYLNAIPDGWDLFSINVDGPIKMSFQTSVQNYVAANVYHFNITATRSGNYCVSVSQRSVVLMAGPLCFSILPATVSPAYCTASWATLTPCHQSSVMCGTAADQSMAFLSFVDRFGNKVEIDAGHVDVSVHQGSRDLAVSLSSDALSLVTTLAANYSVSITIGGSHISGSPWVLLISPHNFVDNGFLTASGIGLTIATAGLSANIQIVARDIFGNSLNSCSAIVADFQLTTAEGGNLYPHWASSQQSGLCLWYISLNFTSSGIFSLRASVWGNPILDSPFLLSVRSAQASALQSTATGSGILAVVQGQTADIMVSARDPFGNLVSDPVDVEVQITYGNGVVVRVPVTQLRASYVPLDVQVGSADVAVTMNGVHISGSPYEVKILPALVGDPVPQNSFLLGTTSSSVLAGTAATFTVQAVDINFAYFNRGGALVWFDLSHSDFYVRWTATDLKDGTYQAAVNLTSSGVYTITISLQGRSIAGSPLRVTVIPAEISAAHCSGYGAGLSAGTAGTVGTFTILTRDKYFNPRSFSVGSLGESFVVEFRGLSIMDASVIDLLDGSYSVQYNITASGQYQVYLIYGDSSSQQPLPLTIESSVLAKISSPSRNMTDYSVGGSIGFAITTKDVFGNSIAPIQSGIGNLFKVVPFVYFEVQLKNQSYELFLNITVAGLYKIAVLVNAVDLIGSPLQISVLPDMLCPQCSVVAGSGLTGCKAGSVGSFLIYARDIYGNTAWFQHANRVRMKLNGTQIETSGILASSAIMEVSYSTQAVCISCAMNIMIDNVDIEGSPFVVSIDPNDAPQILSATLSNHLVGANIVFNVAVYQAAGAFKFDCAEILDDASVLASGNRSTCFWKGSSTLVILFGSNSSWSLGQLVGLKPGVVLNAQRNSLAASGAVPLQFPADGVQPIAVLQGPQHIGPCGSLLLDASASFGSGGRSFLFNWGMNIGPQNAVNLSKALSFLPSNQDKVIIYNTSLIQGETYVFVVEVLSAWGLSASQQLSVQVQSTDIPVIEFVGSPLQVVYSRQMVALRVQSQLSPCARSSNPLTYSWISVGGPPVELAPQTINSSTVVIPENQLLPSRSYTFEVSVSIADIEITAKAVTLNVASNPITAVISGGDRTVSNWSALILDAGASEDPDLANGSFDFQWSCVPEPCFDDVNGIMLTNSPIIAIPGALMRAGETFYFSVTVSKDPGPRLSNATVVISVVDMPLANVDISFQGGYLPKFNPSERLALVGKIEAGNIGCSPTYSWAAEQGLFEPDLWVVLSDSLNYQSLALMPKPALAGQVFSISLKAVCVGEIVGISTVTLNINAPPLGGICSVFPSSGLQYQTVFSIECSDWADDPEDLPLLYLYSVLSDGEQRAPLSSKITTNVLSVVLSHQQESILLAGEVCDSFGACTQPQENAVIVANMEQDIPLNSLYADLVVKGMDLNNLELLFQASRLIATKISVPYQSRRILYSDDSNITMLNNLVNSVLDISETVFILPDFVSFAMSTLSSVMDMKNLDLQPFHLRTIDFMYQLAYACIESGLENSSFSSYGAALSGILQSANNSALDLDRGVILDKSQVLVSLLGNLSLKGHLSNELSTVIHGKLIQLRSQRYTLMSFAGSQLESVVCDMSICSLVSFPNVSLLNYPFIDAQFATWGILLHDQASSILQSNITSVNVLTDGHIVFLNQSNEPIQLEFHYPQDGQTDGGSISNCLFWDLNLLSWNRRGCIVVENSSQYLVCWCYHLTDFVALLDDIEASLAGFNPGGGQLGSLLQLNTQTPILTYVVIAMCITTIILSILAHWTDIKFARSYSPPVADVLFKRGFLSTAVHNKASQYPSLFLYLWSNDMSELIKCSHPVVSIFYRPVKDPCTRPARVLCFSVYLLSVMAINVLWFEQIGFIDQQFLSAGVLTAITLIPLYPMCLALFSAVSTKSRIKKYAAKNKRDQIKRKDESFRRQPIVMGPQFATADSMSQQRIEVESNIDNAIYSNPMSTTVPERGSGLIPGVNDVASFGDTGDPGLTAERVCVCYVL